MDLTSWHQNPQVPELNLLSLAISKGAKQLDIEEVRLVCRSFHHISLPHSNTTELPENTEAYTDPPSPREV